MAVVQVLEETVGQGLASPLPGPAVVDVKEINGVVNALQQFCLSRVTPFPVMVVFRVVAGAMAVPVAVVTVQGAAAVGLSLEHIFIGDQACQQDLGWGEGDLLKGLNIQGIHVLF